MGVATRLEHVLDSRSVPVAVRLIRWTRGRVARLWRRRVLILTTTGRRSGRPRTVVVQYFPDGDDVVVVAANSGLDSNPAWYLNLTAEPRARVEIDGQAFAVHAHDLTDDAATAFWPRVLSQAPDYERYRSRTDRHIPLVRLVVDRPRPSRTGPGPIERASAIDMMELASATTPAAAEVGAVLVLAPGPHDLDAVRSALDERIRAVPRLRQRLQSTPLGCGRPIWVDDASFDIADHVDEAACPAPGGRDAVLEITGDLLARPLPGDRSLWAATLVTGLAEGAAAVVLRFHHVMADGIGGLAVLAALIDGTPPLGETTEFPRAAPRSRSLFVDAVRSRVEALSRAGEIVGRVRSAVGELGRRPPRAACCSLNQPVGTHRALAVARTDLDAFHAAARAHGASINDAALAAITGALHRFLEDRDERVDHLVVSVPVSGRGAATATELGNRIGVMVVRIPTTGSPADRVAAVAAITRSHRHDRRGASAALLAPLFRLLAAVRLLRWVTDHQRMVNVFVTNLRGPDTQVRFLDRAVEDLIPVSSTSGNVRVAFSVFSYAEDLTVTVVADASLRDELGDLTGHLGEELDAIAAAANPGEVPQHHAEGL